MIIDLSNKANQCNPLIRDLQLFNGEIYNFKEIKKKLIENNSYKNKINFKGTSDTEVLINCISFLELKNIIFS